MRSVKKKHWVLVLVGIVWIGAMGITYGAWTYCVQLKIEGTATEMRREQIGWEIPISVTIIPTPEVPLVDENLEANPEADVMPEVVAPPEASSAHE